MNHQKFRHRRRVKEAETLEPKGKWVGYQSPKVDSEGTKLSPEYRWNPNQLHVNGTEHGKPDGVSESLRLQSKQTAKDAERSSG